MYVCVYGWDGCMHACMYACKYVGTWVRGYEAMWVCECVDMECDARLCKVA